MVHVDLHRPVEHDGKTIAVVEYDLDAVTADNVMAALERAEAEAGPSPSRSTLGLRAMQALASKLSGIHYDAFGLMLPADYAAAIDPCGPVFEPFLDLLA